MNVNVKVSLLLSISMIVGILIGLLVAPVLQRNYLERRIENFREPDRFIEKMIETIDPDESQRAEIEKILLNHHERMIEFHARIMSQKDSLIKDLKTVLTPEQIEKMDNMFKMRKPFPRKHGRKHRRR